MTEKVGLIKNPLTIIAIFAGIAEVSGTIVLPFVAAHNQRLFIWFLIIFPTLLIIAFFATLNFNNKVLYAPSDYKDEGNYLLTNKYNAITQSSVIVKETFGEAIGGITTRMEEMHRRFDLLLETNVLKPDTKPDTDNINIKSLYTYRIVNEMRGKVDFIRHMKTLGYDFDIYETRPGHITGGNNPSNDNRGVWLGVDVPLNVAKEVIIEARKKYPFLSYISLNEKGFDSEMVRDIFIGGSTEAAKGHLGLKPIQAHDFNAMYEIEDLRDFHNFIRTFEKSDKE